MRMIITALLVALAVGCSETARPKIPDAAPFYDAAPPPTVPAVPLPPVEGASAADGKARFQKLCAPCHGADARGGGPEAAGLRRAPTDLTHEDYLCRTTFGKQPVPSLADVEGALDRGAHRGRAELAALGPAERRSLTLHVTSLAPGFAHKPLPLYAVPPEPADTPEDRAKGRILFLSFGCWVCHGQAAAGDGTARLAWNGVELKSMPPLKTRAAYVCGESAERVFLTLTLGLGGQRVLMPGYHQTAQWLARPRDGEPATWTRRIEGKVPPDEVARVRALFEGLPTQAQVEAMSTAERQERGARFLWSVVHYIRSLE